MVTYGQLRTFLAVARAGSLTQAARELGASQPTVSLQIKALGVALGTRLVERHGRGLRLTAAGEALRLYAVSALEGLRALQQHLTALESGLAGSLVVGASATAGGYVLPGILSRFRARFPRVEVQLNVDNPEHLFRDLIGGTLDVVLSVGVRTPPGVTPETVRDEDLVVIGSPRHPLARRRRVTPAELGRYPLVTSLPGALFRELVERKLRDAGIVPRVAAEARHPEAMKKLVENDMGWGLLFRPSVADELDTGRLVALRLSRRLTGQIILAVRSQPVLPPLVQQFVRFVRGELRRHPAPKRLSSKGGRGRVSSDPHR